MSPELKVFQDADAFDGWCVDNPDLAHLRTKAARRLLEAGNALSEANFREPRQPLRNGLEGAECRLVRGVEKLGQTWAQVPAGLPSSSVNRAIRQYQRYALMLRMCGETRYNFWWLTNEPQVRFERTGGFAR